MTEVRSHLLSYGASGCYETNNPLYLAVQALTEIVDDIIERRFA